MEKIKFQFLIFTFFWPLHSYRNELHVESALVLQFSWVIVQLCIGYSAWADSLHSGWCTWPRAGPGTQTSRWSSDNGPKQGKNSAIDCEKKVKICVKWKIVGTRFILKSNKQ